VVRHARLGPFSVAYQVAARVLILVAALPAFTDFHVLASGHSDAELLGEATGADVSQVVGDCERERAAHVEASTTVEIPRCGVCTLRTHAGPVLELSPLPERLLPFGRLLALPERFVAPVLVTHESSRGPPRA
jgi:hypothetical protein